MVQIRKPVIRSQDLIDLTTKGGAAGRATNRTARADAARREAERLLEEAIAQALKLQRRRPR